MPIIKSNDGRKINTKHRTLVKRKWFSFAKKEIYKEHKDNKDYDWSKNEIFFDKYKKMYLESIIKLVGKKIYNDSKVVSIQQNCLNAILYNLTIL